MPKSRVEPDACFLNIPYDQQFEKLYLAYIVGLTALGFVPRATLGVPKDARRLNRIFNLIQTCHYSVHDLSRIQLDRKTPRAPRFNMPFELGLAVAWSTLNPRSHSWVGCDAVHHRPVKSISDLNGTDFHIHGGTVKGVLNALCNAFVSRGERPTVPGMFRAYLLLRQASAALQAAAGARDLFQARVFADLVVAARKLWEQRSLTNKLLV
ncbi:MAG TPA: hypothetical protein VFW31_11540 [Candidatus Angelobacter sp.]|nr:hypothetical protein [Candidatus Angelobacter sp.]